MMRAVQQLFWMTIYEWFDALRSRRAMVVFLLYMASSICTMYWSISILGRMESQLASLLQLPASERTGVISTTLWQSKHFQGLMRGVMQNDAVFNDVWGAHPAELIYAWFLFFYMPMLVVLICASRIPEEVGSGAVRYIVARTSRSIWILGKFLGQVSMIGLAVLCSGVLAYAVAWWRLGIYLPDGVCLSMVIWAFKAWIYAIPFIGLVMGLSLFTLSPGKSTIIGILAIMVCFVINVVLNHFRDLSGWWSFLPFLGSILPSDYEMLLWRSQLRPVVSAACFLVTLGFSYLGLGYYFFLKRDV